MACHVNAVTTYISLGIADIFFEHLKAASRLHSFGWEDTAILSWAAVANDAIPRFTDEPWAQAPKECHGHHEEAILHSSPLIFCNKTLCRERGESQTPGKDRTWSFRFTEGKLEKSAVLTLACYMLTG